MFDYVIQFSKASTEELTIDERNILSTAFKNVVGTRRAAWRVISLIERKENKKNSHANGEKAKNYKQQIEQELTGKCNEILKLVNESIYKNLSTASKPKQPKLNKPKAA